MANLNSLKAQKVYEKYGYGIFVLFSIVQFLLYRILNLKPQNMKPGWHSVSLNAQFGIQNDLRVVDRKNINFTDKSTAKKFLRKEDIYPLN